MQDNQLHQQKSSKLVMPKRKPHQGSIRAFFELWLESQEARLLSPTTIQNYRRVVGKFIDFLASEDPTRTPDDITSDDVRKWLVSRRGITRGGASRSTHTINNDFRNSRTFWNWMIYEELTENNPFAKVKPPKKDHVVKPDLSPEQVTRVLEACAGKDWEHVRDMAMVLVILDTGLRIHEVHNLRIADIEDSALVIRGKGGKHRFVYLSAETRLAVHRYLKLCPWDVTGDTPIWCGRVGPFTLDGLKRCVRKIGARAGINPFGAHRMRRTFATWSLRSGCDIETLRQLMGHSTLSVLQGYLSLAQSDLKNAHAMHSPLRTIAAVKGKPIKTKR